MNRFLLFLTLTVAIMLLFSCVKEQNLSPVIPDEIPDTKIQSDVKTGPQTHVWGLFEIEIDPATLTVEIIPSRSEQFTANVVTFLNNNPLGLTISINEISSDSPTEYQLIDVDVSISHPLPGLPKYNGYDVRGVFMTGAEGMMDYGNGLKYGEHCCYDDNNMMGDPTSVGGPDGFTRWHNADEFFKIGLFGYTTGKLASPGYLPSATLCPYKYFADGLDEDGTAWDYLVSTDDNGVFSSGATNTRNYLIRFGMPGGGGEGIRFGYAVIANWESESAHPSNALEAVGCDILDRSNVWWAGMYDNGGDLDFDLSLFGWDEQPENIYVESSVLNAVHQFDSTEMLPIGGGENYSTYHFEMEAAVVDGIENQDYWVIAEYPALTYDNPMGQPNDAIGELLAAFFRFDLTVFDAPPTGVVCDLILDPSTPEMPYEGPAIEIIFDASGSYDLQGGALTFEWDFDDDGIFGDPYDSGTDDKPGKMFSADYVGQVCVRISNGVDEAECCVDLDLTIELHDKNIPLREDVTAMDIAVDHADGDLLVLYSDGSVWKYTEAGGYEDGVQFYLTYEPGSQFIDIAPNSCSVVGFYEYNSADICRMYDEDGAFISSGYISSQCWVHDVIGWTGHTYTNMMGVTTFSCPGGTWPNWKLHGPPTYDVNNYIWAYLAAYGCGATALHRDIIVGVECGNISMQYVYYLEGGNGACNEYRVQRIYRQGGTTLLNDPTVTWGGTRSDDMDGFNDPKDITRDIDNDFYILDYLSTDEPLIKKYDEEGTVIGSFGDSASITGEPFRIEGSDYEGPDGNLMFVIHDGSPADLLSIFYPDEIPD